MNTIFDVQVNPIVNPLIQELAKERSTFKVDIAVQDEMYLYPFEQLENQNWDRTLINYYLKGRTILDSLRQVIHWHFNHFEKVTSFLEFACGYGRVTRFLQQELSSDRIWASDIYEDAVQYQSEYLGVQGFRSTENPEDFIIEQKFDCIFACSFFSHIPESSFLPWMQKLYNLIAPQGILIFSVNDQSKLSPNVSIDSSGIVFSPHSESKSLDHQSYGTTFVTEAFIRSVLDQVSGGQATVYRILQGIARDQDLYLVMPQKTQDFSKLKFKHHPEGYLDCCKLTFDGNLFLSGWVVDFNFGGKIEEVQVIVNGQVLHRCQPIFQRADVAERFNNPNLIYSGWQCSIPKGKVLPQDVVIIKAINNFGLQWIIEASSLEKLTLCKHLEYQLKSTQEHLQITQDKLEKNLEKLWQTEAFLSAKQAELDSVKFLLKQSQTRVLAMESSKFWQFRKQWFKLKEKFGFASD